MGLCAKLGQPATLQNCRVWLVMEDDVGGGWPTTKTARRKRGACTGQALVYTCDEENAPTFRILIKSIIGGRAFTKNMSRTQDTSTNAGRDALPAKPFFVMYATMSPVEAYAPKPCPLTGTSAFQLKATHVGVLFA